MTTSRRRSRSPTKKTPAKSASAAIPGRFAYLRTRNRLRLHSIVLQEFKRANISKAELARRMGKAPEIVTRLLGAPGNWTLDTVSDLLFAICNSELKYEVRLLSQTPQTDRAPQLDAPIANTTGATQTTVQITYSAEAKAKLLLQSV